MRNLDSILKRRDITLLTKVCISQRYGFSSRHVQMWELNHKEGWVLKNWCFRTVLLEKTIKSLLDCKEIKPVNPKGNQPWIFIRSTDAEAETPILWPPDVKSWLIGKDPDAERLKAGGEGDDRGWDGWMASPTQWTWVGANSGRWWWTGRPGALLSMGSQSWTRLSDWTETVVSSGPVSPVRWAEVSSSLVIRSGCLTESLGPYYSRNVKEQVGSWWWRGRLSSLETPGKQLPGVLHFSVKGHSWLDGPDTYFFLKRRFNWHMT